MKGHLRVFAQIRPEAEVSNNYSRSTHCGIRDCQMSPIDAGFCLAICL